MWVAKQTDLSTTLDTILEAQPHGGALQRNASGPQDGALFPADRDPCAIAWPPTLPIEIALKVAPTREICAAYGIERSQWEEIARNPAFIAELAAAVEALRKDGMSFKARAQMQSIELLKESWAMIHDRSGNVPHSVRADLIKFTIRCAGLDASKDASLGQVGIAAGGNGGFAIHINLTQQGALISGD